MSIVNRRSLQAMVFSCAMSFIGSIGFNQAHAADIEAVKNKVRMQCANCHGYDGVAVLSGAANLSGQQVEYLKQQLIDYRSGKRENAMMTVVAKSLTDEDIDLLAEWYANIQITVEPPPE